LYLHANAGERRSISIAPETLRFAQSDTIQLMGEPQGYDPKEIIYRLGTFFLLVGIGLLVFFLLSEAAGTPTFPYFCWSVILLTLAFMFRAQYKRSVQPSGRFSILKRLMPKSKEDKGKKS